MGEQASHILEANKTCGVKCEDKQNKHPQCNQSLFSLLIILSIILKITINELVSEMVIEKNFPDLNMISTNSLKPKSNQFTMNQRKVEDPIRSCNQIFIF